MKRDTAEAVVTKLPWADADQARGLTVGLLRRKLSISEQILQRWRRQFLGLMQLRPRNWWPRTLTSIASSSTRPSYKHIAPRDLPKW